MELRALSQEQVKMLLLKAKEMNTDITDHWVGQSQRESQYTVVRNPTMEQSSDPSKRRKIRVAKKTRHNGHPAPRAETEQSELNTPLPATTILQEAGTTKQKMTINFLLNPPS